MKKLVIIWCWGGMPCANAWMYAGVVSRSLRPLGRRDHHRERAVGLEAVVEQAERLGDPPGVHVLLARQRLLAHRRDRVAVRVCCGRRARRWRGGRACSRTRACSAAVSIAISSTGRRSPNGRLHCWRPARRSATWAHGRLACVGALAGPPRDRDLGTGRSRSPSRPAPPRRTRPRRRSRPAENQVMSPSPTLRATSTSRSCSSENDREAVDLGRRDARRRRSPADTAWHASDSSVSGRPLPNVVWPMPTTAVRPRRETAASRTRHRATSPSSSGVVAPRASRSSARLPSSVNGFSLDEHRLRSRGAATRGTSVAWCSSFFDQPITFVGPDARRVGPLVRRGRRARRRAPPC